MRGSRSPTPERDEIDDVVLDATADFNESALTALQTLGDDDNTIEGTAEEIEDETGCPSHPGGPSSGCRSCQEGMGAAA